jgi:hypothetical protein
MNLFNLKRPSPPSSEVSLEVPSNSIQFTGSATGDGLKLLTEHLSEELRRHAEARLAFLAIARYGADPENHLILCVQGSARSNRLLKSLGNVCSSIFDRQSFVDIIPFEDLSEVSQKQLLGVCSPFYSVSG